MSASSHPAVRRGAGSSRLGVIRAAVGEHRPREYTSTLSWLLSGATRDLRSLVVAFLMGWGFIPAAMIGAVVGAVTGGVSGLSGSVGVVEWVSGLPVVGAFTTSIWAGLSGVLGIALGALLGAVVGAVTFFLYPVVLVLLVAELQGGSWLQIPLTLSTALLLTIGVGVGYALWSIVTEGGRQGVGGARRMSHREADRLVPLVHELSLRIGCSNAPRILVDDDDATNAYAGAWHITVTQGLLRLTEHDEEALAGVLAHELMHWRNADAVTSMFLRGMALPAYALYNLTSRLGAGVRLLLLFPIPVRVTLQRIFVPVQAAGTRNAEYRADQAAVLTGAGVAEGLSRALEGFREIEAGRNGWEEAVCATHPPTELRLERLRAALEREAAA